MLFDPLSFQKLRLEPLFLEHVTFSQRLWDFL